MKESWKKTALMFARQSDWDLNHKTMTQSLRNQLIRVYGISEPKNNIYTILLTGTGLPDDCKGTTKALTIHFDELGIPRIMQ